MRLISMHCASAAARSYFIGPEGESGRVRLAVKKVVIVLANAGLRVIIRIGGRLCRVIDDGNGGDRRRTNAVAPGRDCSSSVTLKVSLPSTKESSLMSTAKLFDVSAGPKDRVLPRAVM